MRRLVVAIIDVPTTVRHIITSGLAWSALLAACVNDAALPTVPTPVPVAPAPGAKPYGPTGSIAGFVLDESEQCIIGARVELRVDATHSNVFTQTVCAGFWDYLPDQGFVFHELPVGAVFTIRAIAPGYRQGEVRASAMNPYQYATYIVLEKE